MLLLSLLLILILISVLLYRKVPLPAASAIVVVAWLVLGVLSPAMWSLWLVIPPGGGAADSERARLASADPDQAGI